MHEGFRRKIRSCFRQNPETLRLIPAICPGDAWTRDREPHSKRSSSKRNGRQRRLVKAVGWYRILFVAREKHNASQLWVFGVHACHQGLARAVRQPSAIREACGTLIDAPST